MWLQTCSCLNDVVAAANVMHRTAHCNGLWSRCHWPCHGYLVGRVSSHDHGLRSTAVRLRVAALLSLELRSNLGRHAAHESGPHKICQQVHQVGAVAVAHLAAACDELQGVVEADELVVRSAGGYVPGVHHVEASGLHRKAWAEQDLTSQAAAVAFVSA